MQKINPAEEGAIGEGEANGKDDVVEIIGYSPTPPYRAIISTPDQNQEEQGAVQSRIQSESKPDEKQENPHARSSCLHGLVTWLNECFGCFYCWVILTIHLALGSIALLSARVVCHLGSTWTRNLFIWFLFQPLVACNRIATQLVVTGDSMNRNRSAPFILMGNHQCVADFQIFATWLCFHDRAYGIMWAVWAMLQYLPLGWVMSSAGTACYLQGSGKRGRKMIEKMRQKLHNFRRTHFQSFVLFPEGTIMKDSEQKKSQAYAERMGFVHLEHVLLPRHLALQMAVQELAVQGVDELYDVTIYYPPKTKYAQQRYNMGRVFAIIPQGFKVQLHVRKYSIREEGLTDMDDEGFRDWLHRVYQRKEVLLAKAVVDGAMCDELSRHEGQSLVWCYFVLLLWAGSCVGCVWAILHFI
jgi:1-acyl-sn-glycerol-3-phosphate acyltransferase